MAAAPVSAINGDPRIWGSKWTHSEGGGEGGVEVTASDGDVPRASNGTRRCGGRDGEGTGGNCEATFICPQDSAPSHKFKHRPPTWDLRGWVARV